jgi:hypothetical protein
MHHNWRMFYFGPASGRADQSMEVRLILYRYLNFTARLILNSKESGI